MSEGPGPLLTVAIPVYNGAAALAPMLASLDGQDWGLFEVRFGDDGSTDGTPDVLAGFAARHPGRVFAERHGNMGPGPSRNRLLAQAAGDYIWFCDADDELAPGCIARIAEILRANPVDMLAFLYGQGGFPGDATAASLDAAPIPVSRAQLLSSALGATVSKVVRTALLRAESIEFPNLRAGEDFVWTASAAAVCGAGAFWYAKPYWVRNGFWERDGADHLTKAVDGTYCENVLEAVRRLDALQSGHPDVRMEIGLQKWILAIHLRDRVRDEAGPDVRERWLPVAQGLVHGMAEARDNPLLRTVRAFKRKEDAAIRKGREALVRERAALRAALRREQAALARERAVLSSVSWRVTWPLRAVARPFRRNGRRATGGGR